MIAHHFGTDEIPRQCVTPGDYVLHEVGHISLQQTILKRENSIFVTSQQKHALPTA